MTVRLATLRASASLNATDYSRGAQQVSSANQKMVQGQAGVNRSMQETATRTSSTAAAFDKYRQHLDPVYRAQQNLVLGQERLNAALAKGQITAAQHAAYMQTMQKRYDGVVAAQARSASGIGVLISQYKFLAVAAAAAVASLGFREYIQAADAMTNYSSRIRLVAGSLENAASVQKQLFEIANRTRVGIEGVVVLYARLGRSADELGISQERLLKFVESFSQALKISGASTAEANSTVLQLSQALASGYLRGAELNAVLEAGGRAATALAEGLGVPIGQLKKLGEEGELTAQRVIAAIESQATTLQTEFDQMATTVGDTLTVVNNKWLEYVGKVDQATAASREVAQSVSDLGETLNDPQVIEAGVAVVKGLVDAFTVLAKVVTGAYLAIQDLRGVLGTSQNLMAFKFGGMPAPTTKQYNNGVSENFFYNPSSSDDGLFAVPAYSPAAEEEKAVVKLGKTRNKEADAEAKRAAARESSVKRYIDDLETETRLAKMLPVEREKEAAVLRAIEIAGRKITDVERQRIVNAIDLKNKIEEQQEAEEDRLREAEAAQKRMAEESAAFKEDVTADIADGLYAIFTRGKDGVDDFVDYWKQRFIRLLADMAAEALVNPIIMPVIQSAAGALGLGGQSGGLGANFGGSGVGGVGSIFGGLSKSIDNLGQAIGIQGFKPSAGTPEMLKLDAQGLFGTETFLSDVLGGALGGIGMGSTVASLTGGNSVGGAVGGLVGGALGSFLGPIGSMIGSALGGFIGGLFGPKPTNASAVINYDENYNRDLVTYPGKTTAQTLEGIQNAGTQIEGVVKALETVGTTFSDRITQIVIGQRDPSRAVFASGKTLSSAVGDPNALALTAIKGLLETATFTSQSVALVAGKNFQSLEEMVTALDFAISTYDKIAMAKPALTATEQAMEDLTKGLENARREAKKFGLSIEALDAGATKLFNFDIATQIQQIVDPVGAALSEFERGAAARIRVAEQLGADLVQVERLNALEREAVIKQASQQSVAGLKALINDIEFGNLSLGVAPEQQYFSALTAYNQARDAALNSRSPEAIDEFQNQARAFLPIAQSFLGVSTRFGEVRSGILETAKQLGTAVLDANTSAIIAATLNGSNQVVQAVKAQTEETKNMRDELKGLGGLLRAMFSQNNKAA